MCRCRCGRAVCRPPSALRPGWRWATPSTRPRRAVCRPPSALRPSGSPTRSPEGELRPNSSATPQRAARPGPPRRPRRRLPTRRRDPRILPDDRARPTPAAAASGLRWGSRRSCVPAPRTRPPHRRPGRGGVHRCPLHARGGRVGPFAVSMVLCVPAPRSRLSASRVCCPASSAQRARIVNAPRFLSASRVCCPASSAQRARIVNAPRFLSASRVCCPASSAQRARIVNAPCFLSGLPGR